MNWLLKITQGPMSGAEIALVNGTRVTFGRSERCDIVVADASLADEAFSLDVSETGVSLMTADGSALTMRPFETRMFGTTQIAVGPEEGAWEELRPASDADANAPTDGAEATTEGPTSATAAGADSLGGPASATAAGADSLGGSASVSAEGSASSAEGSSSVSAEPAKKSHVKKILLIALPVAVLLAAVLAAAWFFLPLGKDKKQTGPVVTPQDTLRQVAKEHGLSYQHENGTTKVSGDVKRRTERMAIRALAHAADRHCAIDVSDDETLLGAANALLFTVTEGAVKVASAAKRAVALKGYAPNGSALAQVLAAVRSDVPWVTKVDSKGVTVGGSVPEDLVGNRFAETGEMAGRSRGAAEPVELFSTKNLPKPAVPTNGASVAATAGGPTSVSAASSAGGPTSVSAASSAGGPTSVSAEASMDAEERAGARLAARAASAGGKLPREMLPVAGILTKPYACVVLADGHRLVLGAKISGLEITGIEPARITFVFRGATIRWEP